MGVNALHPLAVGACLLVLGACGDRREDLGAKSDGGVVTLGGTSAETTTGDSSSEAEDSVGPKLDVAAATDLGPLGCGEPGSGNDGEDEEPEFSFIWIANSSEGTISKIDTQTLQEKGRYLVRADGLGSPSRTSVNLSGDVAVANRLGGVTKVLADAANCPDTNGDGVITTSTGPQDIKPWGQDDCVAWFSPFDYATQRPMAWAPGEWNPTTCAYENEMLWTSGAVADVGGTLGIDVLLLDGATGVVEQKVHIPEVPISTYGMYGGAVDGNGNFWASQLGIGKLVYVDRETFDYRVWDMPVGGYGMTVDSDGYVWTCAHEVGRFDPKTETWATAVTGGSGGCMADGEGRLWQGGSSLFAVDTQTLAVVDTVPLPNYVHGVSIDFYGYVWGVTLQQPDAYRVDPLTKVTSTFTGLTGPYTYSDMTGFALKHAGTAPMPQG